MKTAIDATNFKAGGVKQISNEIIKREDVEVHLLGYCIETNKIYKI